MVSSIHRVPSTPAAASDSRRATHSSHTLGELDQVVSRRLMQRPLRLGAVAVHACEIDTYDGRSRRRSDGASLAADGRLDAWPKAVYDRGTSVHHRGGRSALIARFWST
jgi:hypothetical protein